MGILDQLNAQQRAAAAHGSGPMLILAGAGSGKTRVITHRIAHLLETGVPPSRIVAVTFTNKAAGEMRERVLRLLRGGREVPRPPWLGTFHAFCLRLLRIEVERTELRPGFVVLDQEDSRALVKACERELGIDEKTWLPRRVHGRIPRWKADCIGPDELPEMVDDLGEIAARVLPLYQRKLVEANACDFDDLLMRAVLLLERDDDVRERHQERTEHLLVDEYQDTNAIQYRLIRLLSARHGNVCAVGDEDQSIYAFRGADIGNILRFETDFPGTTVHRVEQNYRSTGNVLAAANGVVEHNAARKGKVLWTDNEPGDPVRVVTHGSDLDEADWVAREVGRLAEEHGYAEVAVAYRTNAQSRLLEQSLARRGIPHVVIGGLRFYERREVKDVLAFLRLIVNSHDDVAVERVLNVPPRGIGQGAREQVRALSREHGTSLWPALVEGVQEGRFTARAERALDGFIELVETLQREARERPLPDVLRLIVDATGYDAELEKEGREIARDRRQNLQELVNAGAEFAERDADGGPSGFLSELALASDVDGVEDQGRVHLMTLHAAKGLEFDAVILCGVEEDLFPHASAAEADEDVEEERRLCYVGMTRARRKLVMTHALSRRVFGQPREQRPSRFLDEIPDEHVKREGTGATSPWSRRERGGGAVSDSARDAVSSFFGDAEIAWEDVSQDPDDAPAAAAAPSAAGVPPRSAASATTATAGRRAAPPKAPDRALRKGDLVKHRRYGVGTITGMEGSGAKCKLTVYFAGKGRVKLMQAHAPIERVK